MRGAQRLWRRTVQLQYWLFVTISRMYRGRLYIFRDSPGWFVRLVCMAPHPGTDEHGLLTYWREAKAEQKTRRRV